MKSSKPGLRNGVTVIGHQVLDMAAKAAMVIDKHLIELALTVAMVVMAIPLLLRRQSVAS